MVPGVTQVHCGYSPSTATRASLAVKRARGPRKQFQAPQLKLSRSRLHRLIQFLFLWQQRIISQRVIAQYQEGHITVAPQGDENPLWTSLDSQDVMLFANLVTTVPSLA